MSATAMSQSIKDLVTAAKRGDTVAQYDLGCRYREGYEVQRDPLEAFHWLREAANRRHIEAIYELGVCYEEGIGTTADKEHAFACFMKAAEAQCAPAFAAVGLCYKNGNGIRKDYGEAIRWLEKAVAHGESDVEDELTVSTPFPDDPALISWVEALAEHGYQDAQFAVADHYYRPLPRDTALAVHWYRKAAEQGQRGAQFALGTLLAKGDGISKDTRQAAVWLEKAAEQHLECAMDSLGQMYADEESGITDMVKAANWWRRLEVRDDGSGFVLAAKFQLSWCYALGEGVEGNTDMAWDLLLEAAPPLARDAERLFEGKSWWKAKAFGGNRNALYWLGECYNQFATHRTDLCRAYKQEAFTYFKRAAELGQAEAQDAVGHIQCHANLEGSGTKC